MRLIRRSGGEAVFAPKREAERKIIHEAVTELRYTIREGALTERGQAALQGLLYRLNASPRAEDYMAPASDYLVRGWRKQRADTPRKPVLAPGGGLNDRHAAEVPELADFFKEWLKDDSGLHDRMMTAYLHNGERGRLRAS